MVSVASGPGSLFKVAAQCHPAMIDPADAARVTTPMCMLSSEEEPAAEVQAFEKALTVEKHVEMFPDQLHGWMTARADLEKESVRKEYERAYRTVLEFFAKHLP